MSFFGEYLVDEYVGPIRASVVIAVLEQAGVAAPATRATLDRLVQSGLLLRERSGREIMFSLTEHATAVLREATDRVRSPEIGIAHDEGWTLVTFSIPEEKRQLRHRLRATLAWEGFAPLRDGLWLAPGEVDLESSLEPLRSDLPIGSLAAFYAHELAGFSIAESVRTAWDIDAIRAAHEEFIAEWSDAPPLPDGVGTPASLARLAMLVADWLALQRVDPRLPVEYLDDHWPAARSFELYRRRRSELKLAANAEFDVLVAPRERIGIRSA
nr:PaaX family transcriptional regulator C-terminal domain-containing protein [Microbacterium endophyticum]